MNGTWQFPEKLISLYGDGQNGRDWPYAEDHVDAMLPAATQGTPRRAPYSYPDQQRAGLGATP